MSLNFKTSQRRGVELDVLAHERGNKKVAMIVTIVQTIRDITSTLLRRVHETLRVQLRLIKGVRRALIN